MDEHLSKLVEGIGRWRSHEVGDYWISVGYLGSSVNRLGDHAMTFVDGKLYHLWGEKWREIAKGSEYWLFSIPGSFAWARDMITKVVAGDESGDTTFELAVNEEYGYVEFMRVKTTGRDSHNFTFEIRQFGVGAHPDFEG